jgi:hypothetical protein
VGTLWDFNNVVMALEIPSWELLWMLSPTFARRAKGGMHKGFELSHIRANEQIFMSMWNVKIPLFGTCEFPSNFFFTNIKLASPSKPILLKCKGEPKTILHIIFANLFGFGG